MPRISLGSRVRSAVSLSIFAGLIFAAVQLSQAEGKPPRAYGFRQSLEWTFDSPGGQRFIAVHGRQSLISGYSDDGLEIWAYPLQLVRNYSVSFRRQGSASSISGKTILRQLIYRPQSVTRVYVGADFIVRETLFVPLDRPGAVVSYEVESSTAIEIVVHFTPVLDLMWPAGLGGQETVWSPSTQAYVLSEGSRRYFGAIVASNAVAHDPTPNSNKPLSDADGVSVTIVAGGSDEKTASVAFSASFEVGQDPAAQARALLRAAAKLQEEAAQHYLELLEQMLKIETPDQDINRALAWSEIALDQAWVCNRDLGCGIVAGYGPSRKARRPQYAWFFAGDGLVAVHALVGTGEFSRARSELEFVIKNQDPEMGMIWHELSQSAAQLDWKKYPYLFGHVDVSFDFLRTVDEYVAASGDRDFVREHWKSLRQAFAYCTSLIDEKDGLPRIPADKMGGNEQDRLSDELSLSSAWVDATESFAKLAAIFGDPSLAATATRAGKKARGEIAQRYWNEEQHFWISGYSRAGKPATDKSIGPSRALAQNLFSRSQRNGLLDQLASADFQTDWGTRNEAPTSSSYDPNSYAKGSVWAISTAAMAQLFWAEHRPASALPMWSSLVPWTWLDSPGHLHEVMAGNFYREEMESVPEQTWSSAELLTSAVRGLLGLQVDPAADSLMFAPHLPADWPSLNIDHVRVGKAEIKLALEQTLSTIDLNITNNGGPVLVEFAPEIPLGAHVTGAMLNGKKLPANDDIHSQDEHARTNFQLPQGNSHFKLAWTGGVSVKLESSPPQLAEASTAPKLVDVTLAGNKLTISLDLLPEKENVLELRTPWKVSMVEGASLQKLDADTYRLTTQPVNPASTTRRYDNRKIAVTFAK